MSLGIAKYDLLLNDMYFTFCYINGLPKVNPNIILYYLFSLNTYEY